MLLEKGTAKDQKQKKAAGNKLLRVMCSYYSYKHKYTTTQVLLQHSFPCRILQRLCLKGWCHLLFYSNCLLIFLVCHCITRFHACTCSPTLFLYSFSPSLFLCSLPTSLTTLSYPPATNRSRNKAILQAGTHSINQSVTQSLSPSLIQSFTLVPNLVGKKFENLKRSCKLWKRVWR